MSTHLHEILAYTRRDLACRKQSADRAALETRAARHTPRGFAKALRHSSHTGPAIIAELKKASPSRGLIRAEFDASSLAAMLAGSGAAALSVLTEEHFFQGSLGNLEQASAAASIPCLRKDFIVDEFQILEARAFCADAILLIAAALDDTSLHRLTHAAHAMDLDVLCEVHNGEEAARVLGLGCDAVGVNNRNLNTLEVNIEVSLELARSLPAGMLHVAESGIATVENIARLRAAGFGAFLIGESLMRQSDPGKALVALLANAGVPHEVPV